MGGITSSVGLFSGIDTASLIDQLISVESRPRVLAQSRLIQLQSQRAAYLDVNSRIDTLANLAKSFRTENLFQNKKTSVSDSNVLTATAGQSAALGSYDFIVDRLVSTQQVLSRGFSSRDGSGLGLETLTFEGAEARLDRETSLSDLNNGDGVVRGELLVNGETVDLSRAADVDDVLEALNRVSGVSARADGGRLVVDGLTSIENADDERDVLGTLGLDTGIASGTVTGSTVYGINELTPLEALNDGRGLGVRTTSGTSVYDIAITVDTDGNGIIDGADTEVRVRLGDIEEEVDDSVEVTEAAVSTVGGALERINAALADAGLDAEISATVDQSSGSISITDTSGRDIQIEDFTSSGSSSTAARDLGIAGTFTGGTVSGERVFAGINSTLVSSLNGGTGLGATDGLIDFTAQDGTAFTVDVSGLGDVNDIINAINTDATNGGRVVAAVNETGNGIALRDTSVGGGTFEVSGTPGADAAAALGIDGTFASGSTDGANLQLAYIGTATKLSSLNGGQGLGSGSFEIIDSNNVRTEITIGSGDETLADVIRRINGSAADVNARINDTGDGIIIEDTGGGGAEIEISDTEGNVARDLRIEGTSGGLDGDNFIDGSLETSIEIDSTSTLEEIVDAINASAADVSASIVNTGSGASPFRLSITSDRSGSDGRFVIDSGGFDMGLSTLDEGDDARVFFGSEDAANGVLISSSTNSIENVIEGVSISLTGTSDTAVTIGVSSDTSGVEEKINEFVEAYNTAIDRINFQTRFDEESGERGPLLGDGTLASLSNSMFSTLLRSNDGFNATFNNLTEVGISVGSESKIEFDSAKFREALAEDPEAVEALFTRRTIDTAASDDDDPNTDDELVFSELGVMVQFERFTELYTDSINGVLENRSTALDDQILIQEERIAGIQARLDARRQQLSREFLAMEQAIASFQSQGQALSQITSLG